MALLAREPAGLSDEREEEEAKDGGVLRHRGGRHEVKAWREKSDPNVTGEGGGERTGKRQTSRTTIQRKESCRTRRRWWWTRRVRDLRAASSC
eukprot:754666-Hanusia_phi.AAC.2